MDSASLLYLQVVPMKMAPIKRNHKTLSLKEKSAIIDELKRGISGKSLALKYGVGTSTISDIKIKSDKIKENESKEI
ncbi:hypothetical protein NQ314_000289 [Rhamnusium bicolor]|uniref:HTH psq-type domain-containing protein n=1 Tax=Rhamnusium bicolor TaxID=1586634 RepID=A0AAV8ZW86_9CUCU|nr:hypothetical protein NQ314_000289 [Rhamnusium bicolor]